MRRLRPALGRAGGDAFGRAARRFEELGAGAVLVNCIPPDHVEGMVSYQRDFTDLPLGVYPNLGYLTTDGWRFDSGVSGEEYGGMALGWREEGAQIIGGCCGVGPEHIAAARRRLGDTPPGRRRAAPDFGAEPPAAAPPRPEAVPAPWTDAGGRPVYPLEFPDIAVGSGVFLPTQGSFLVWRHLFQQRMGAGRRCLDIGCGSGLETVQLAFNGARHVHAIDLDAGAVADTLTNAFRNGVRPRERGV